MLESRRFVLAARPAGSDRARRVAVAGAAGAVLGHAAEERVPPVVTALRWLGLARLAPATWTVREGPDGSHVFTVARPAYLRRPRYAVSDAQGDRVGGVVPARAGGWLLADAAGRPFARVVPGPVTWVLAARRPRRLARIRRSPRGVVVRTAARLDGQPLTKMLVLAAALAGDW